VGSAAGNFWLTLKLLRMKSAALPLKPYGPKKLLNSTALVWPMAIYSLHIVFAAFFGLLSDVFS